MRTILLRTFFRPLIALSALITGTGCGWFGIGAPTSWSHDPPVVDNAVVIIRPTPPSTSFPKMQTVLIVNYDPNGSTFRIRVDGQRMIDTNWEKYFLSKNCQNPSSTTGRAPMIHEVDYVDFTIAQIKFDPTAGTGVICITATSDSFGSKHTKLFESTRIANTSTKLEIEADSMYNPRKLFVRYDTLEYEIEIGI